MERKRQRIEEDLRGLVAGEVRCDPVFRQLYATDASLFVMEPLGVVAPRSTADVVATVQYASENGIPIHARGAGSGLAGGAVGPGLVVDFSRSMRKIGPLVGETIRVQPGAVIDVLNRRLAKEGRRFGPDPAKRKVSTLGGAVAVDASGSHWLRSGSVRTHVEALEVVLADGTVLELGRHPVEPRTDGAGAPRLEKILRQTAGLIQQNAETVTGRQPETLVNTSGYGVDGVLKSGTLDLARIIAGSEGTLALITGITLATEQIPAHRSCALLFFDRLEKAAEAIAELLPLAPSACDLMDRRHLNLARAADVHFELILPGAAEAVLLIEFEGDEDGELREKINEAIDRIEHRTSLAAGSYEATEPEDVDLVWRLAQSFAPALARMKGQTRTAPFIEDIAVPPKSLGPFLTAAQRILRENGVTASLFSHAGHGQVHLRPLVDLSDPRERKKLVAVADDLYELVWQIRGTISGEHGDGLSRTPYLQRQYGPLCDVFQSLKQVFDPDNIFNPGKIVMTPVVDPLELLSGRIFPDLPASFESDERKQLSRKTGSEAPAAPEVRDTPNAFGAASSLSAQSAKLFDLQLAWQPDDVSAAVARCNRCGLCREESDQTRMCPVFHFGPKEEASPRSKANLLAAILAGRLEPESVSSDEFKQIADLCVHCHMCRLECPAEVDIPRLMVEAKAAYVRENGMAFRNWIFARIDRYCGVACRFPSIANWALSNGPMRWLAEKLIGLSQRRKIPRFARRAFLQQVRRRGLHRAHRNSDGERVAYFVDTFANSFDVELAEAMVDVLEHNGVAVYVPPDQRGGGMPLVAQGAVEAARQVASHNVAALAEAVRKGYSVVATEPSAALALAREYPLLLPDDEDAVLVAEATNEACQFLWKLHLRGTLRLDFQNLGLTIGYHVPCHLKALEIGTPAENLLRLLPGVQVERWEKGCSGMAGMFGLAKQNYRNSLRAGRPLITAIRESNCDVGTTECCTCKMQMEHATTTPTVHPIKLLAWAYGLGVEVRGRGGSEVGGRRSGNVSNPKI